MRSAALVLAVLAALGAAVAAAGRPDQGSRPAPRRRPEAAPPAAAPKPRRRQAGGGRSIGPRSNSPIVIDADRMEAMKKEGLIIFTGNVVAKQENSVQTADRMEVYLDDKGERVIRIVSTGNVKIVTEDCRTGTAKRAEYYDDDQTAHAHRRRQGVAGGQRGDRGRDRIFLADDRSTVRGGNQARVKSVFYPKRDENKTERDPQGRRGDPQEC